MIAKKADSNIGDMPEEEAKEMWLESFFWVAVNRPEWLEEAIKRKKLQIQETQRKGR